MNLVFRTLTVAAVLAAATASSAAQDSRPGVERLYVIDCGQGRSPDQSRWSPGVNVNQPIEMVSNCYLIKHAHGYLMWETGVGDTYASLQEGRVGQGAALTWRLGKTLAVQLDEIGVKPADVRFVAVSHTHNDHIGNVEMFPKAMLLVQKAEYEWPSPFGVGRFKPEHPVSKLEGDHDVFGDGSVMLLSTPGHTPGHQSIMVKLPKSGAVVISGDAVHFKDNWDNRRVPGFNVDAGKSSASMQRIADLLTQHKAQLWIHHDKPQSDAQKKAPQFYE
jgi:glyoxylase-like metal-dependent hydrolase (beta-lactamase superfamily II)